ncbi:TonB-dependent receptor [Sphingomonas nostoxanthinifaciens]|uniref:TonB-dependent receptor n=1 Tax=Sphingomonas nostoxanthinifaciens TaxID=2872652 RepID=UPI001CC207EF|nr:TonB-dependent receptor [Sphingomonas nostoxanthinifaciens]
MAFPGRSDAQNGGGPQQGAEATNAQPGPAPAISQAEGAQRAEDIIVTGIRASLERSIAIKRDSVGVVDAISAEDIGKFPDTNLAESLQRITGVSINRRNGEGSDVTVRGFSAQYNLVTLNGRQLAASDQQNTGGGEDTDFSRSTSRSFDFSNLASEGVKTLEVYKTGRAAIPSGGIGATINVVTRRPLDSRESGLNGSIGAKAVYDSSSDDCVSCGSHVTPEVSGLASWSNAEQTFGVSVFGSYQKRDFSNISATVQGWNITTLAQFLDPNNGNVNANTKINNAPTDPNALVARPNDFRYHFGEAKRERINGQAILQFKPTDRLDISVDGLFAQNRQSERRSDQSNWFNRPFDVVTFDGGHSVATTSYLHEMIAGETKDSGFEQQYRGQKSQLYDAGLNAKWDLTDNFRVAFDGHIGESKSTPDNPNGMSSTLVAISAPILSSHATSYAGGFPTQTVVFSDPSTPTTLHPTIKGNGNGQLDVGDLGSQVGRQVATTFRQRIKEARLDAGWDLGGGSRFDFGGDFRTTNTRSTQTQYTQTLGDWGNANPRDVQQYAPGVVQQFCLVCRFSQFDPKATGDGLIAFRAQDPTKLYNLLSAAYTATGNPNNANKITGFSDDRVKEDIYAAYTQVTWKGEIAGHAASLVAGARYEKTITHANSLQAIPLNIVWQSDNDFTTIVSSSYQPVTGKGNYDNLLPSMDFQVNIRKDLIGRFSFSRTISRPSYGNLFASVSASPPSDATAVGGTAGGAANDTNLKPLVSDNFDLSLEWYFKPDSYVSAGFFDKRVHNFIGNTVVKRNLFGLRDPSSGAAGSRSGTAKAQLQTIGADITDVNLFTYTALLQQNGGNLAAANATFLANYNSTARALNQAFVDTTLAAVDIIADNNDPLFNFNVNTPINNKDAEIYGLEIAGQYFFGNSGIGVSAAYTLVRGDIGIDVAADPNVDQFALIGLSDTANATLIYDKYGISARLSYNWRGKFLSAVNKDAFHNPEFTKAYGQVDLNISYDVTPHLALSVEAINLNKESVVTYARSTNEIWLAQEGQRRFLFGARYRW